jgi:PIN domain nuclease of toxin-antitoxin system
VKLLLDTHILLWWLEDSQSLTVPCRNLIAAQENVVFISAATIWEIRIKQSIGKLALPENFAEIIDAEPFERLSITNRHAHEVFHLPMHHKDPFDRMLIAQARLDDLTLVSHDKVFERYEVPCQIFS